MRLRILFALCLAAFLACAAPAAAQDFQFTSIPAEEPAITNWMTQPVTEIAREVRKNALWITILVLPYLVIPQVLLLYIIFKFRKRPGAKPATFHENVKLEVAWTIIPALTLVVIAVPSYGVIKMYETMPEAEMNIEVIGHQFFWRYVYIDHHGEPLEIEIANEPLVIPVNTTIVAGLTSVDVNHAWWVPAFGVKMDTIPGRLNQIWFNVEETGWYKGQCAELCGALHAKMLIDVYVVTEEEFQDWVAHKRAAMELPAEGDESPDEEALAGDTTAIGAAA